VAPCRRRGQPRGRKALLDNATLLFVRPATPAASVNDFEPTDVTIVGKHLHTDSQLRGAQARKAVRAVCLRGWRMLPHDFPPWQTVYWWFRRFVRLMLFRTIHDLALMVDRERAGREASPTAAVVDSQTVKAPAPGAKRGYDAAQKTVGRKRHILVDTDGRLLMVNLTPADLSDSAGGQMLVAAIRKRWPWIKHLFADGAYDRTALIDKAAFHDFVVEVIRRIDREPGFKVLPRRWVVERTFGWMTRWRRLVRDSEQRLDVSEAMIHVAMGGLLLRPISH